jgi:hypothetical protein
MTTQRKIEKKGYKVTFNTGWRDGEQRIVSVSATKDNAKITQKNITTLLKSL